MDFIIGAIGLLSYFIFILAGFGCAYISGYIEYNVFMGLFPKNSILIPILIVIAFESTKVFLVFFVEKIKHNDKVHVENKKVFGYLRTVLIILSGFCTLIYAAYNLYNPNYDKALEKSNAMLLANYEAKQTQINDFYQQSKGDRLREYQQDVDKWKDEMDKEALIVDSNGNYIGPNYRRFERKYHDARQRLSREEERIEDERLEKIEELALVYERDQKNQMSSLKADIASDNKMISAALQIIWRTSSYPKTLYLLIILFLSILISIGLEAVIWSSFKILAITPSQWLHIDFGKINMKSTNKLQLKLFRPVLPGIIFFSTWVIINLIFDNLPNTPVFFILIFVFIGSFSVFVGGLISERYDKKEIRGWRRIKNKVLGVVISSITTGILTFFIVYFVGVIMGDQSSVNSFLDFGVFVASGGVAKIGSEAIYLNL